MYNARAIRTIGEIWQARRESNPQPAVLETAALPIELLAFSILFHPYDNLFFTLHRNAKKKKPLGSSTRSDTGHDAGTRRATAFAHDKREVEDRPSLSLYGAHNWIRTSDLSLTKGVLYRLSYMGRSLFPPSRFPPSRSPSVRASGRPRSLHPGSVLFRICLALIRWNRGLMERVMGIEPTSSAWKAEVLPLNYTRTRPRLPSAGSREPTDRTRTSGIRGFFLRLHRPSSFSIAAFSSLLWMRPHWSGP